MARDHDGMPLTHDYIMPQGREMIRGVDLLLFAAVPQRKMLDQGFYAAEAEGLRAHPCVRSVMTTNDLADVRRSQVDGIVSYFYSHSALIGAIARARGIPAIATGGAEQLLRDPATPRHLYAARIAAFRASALLMTRLLPTSSEDAERMRAIAWAGRDRITLSFHGVSATEQASPQHFTHDRDDAALVTIAGLDTPLNVRRKGVLDAVDLLARFYHRDPSATLTIIGRPTCRDMVVAHAMDRGVAEAVRFTGYVTEEEKLAALHRARFYVQLSDYEGFGIGALEALAHGCQVIHTNVGGLRDTIGSYGVILNRDDIARFDPATVPAYAIPDWPGFMAHLEQFGVTRRATSILQSLGLDAFDCGSTDPSSLQASASSHLAQTCLDQ